MAKKTGKIILFGIIAGVTAAGVYHYLQNQKNNIEEFDDFDDLDNFDDIPDDTTEEKSRSYITLDTAKVFVNDTVGKAKNVFSKAKNKLQEVISESNEAKADEVTEEIIEEETTTAEEPVEDTVPDESVEEFFDDDDI